MNCLILGGDERYYQIINNFVNKGYNVDIVGYKKNFEKVHSLNYNELKISEYDIIIFPINGVGDNFLIKAEQNFNIKPDILNTAKNDCLIFSGINTPCLEQIKILSKKNINFLMQDKEVISENVIPTVEGIVADLILNTDITLDNSKIMVIGYGNVGSYLVDILKKLKANLVVSIIRQNDKKNLEKQSIASIYSYDILAMQMFLSHVDMIVNTVPTLVLDKKYIDFLKEDCYVLDIASKPYGIDKNYLDKKQIKNKIYSGIPADIAPKTSGNILLKKINSIIGGSQK